jgi:hypothetical protein
MCIDVGGVDYGSCDKVLGVGYDGQHCKHYSGCSCAPNCAGFHADLPACLAACAGKCDPAAFVGKGIAPKSWGVGDFCDEVFVCVSPGFEAQLKSIYPQATCSPGGGLCNGKSRCTLDNGGTVAQSSYDGYCSLTLIEWIEAVYCIVYA